VAQAIRQTLALRQRLAEIEAGCRGWTTSAASPRRRSPVSRKRAVRILQRRLSYDAGAAWAEHAKELAER